MNSLSVYEVHQKKIPYKNFLYIRNLVHFFTKYVVFAGEGFSPQMAMLTTISFMELITDKVDFTVESCLHFCQVTWPQVIDFKLL